MGHPLEIALSEANLSKEELASRVRKAQLRRANGKRLHLSVNYIGQIIRGDRHPHRLMADAIAGILGKDESFAVLLERWSPGREDA